MDVEAFKDAQGTCVLWPTRKPSSFFAVKLSCLFCMISECQSVDKTYLTLYPSMGHNMSVRTLKPNETNTAVSHPNWMKVVVTGSCNQHLVAIRCLAIAPSTKHTNWTTRLWAKVFPCHVRISTNGRSASACCGDMRDKKGPAAFRIGCVRFSMFFTQHVFVIVLSDGIRSGCYVISSLMISECVRVSSNRNRLSREL